MTHDLHIVVLAAGKSTRMKSARPKVLHDLAGRMLIEHVLHTTKHLGATSTTLVIGHAADDVRASLQSWTDLQYAVQSPQLGTGHALLQTEPLLAGKKGTVLLLYGDVPLLMPATLQRLLEAHRQHKAAATILTTELPDPYGYGRIVRDAGGSITRIVEERDASADERGIHEINSGIYAFSTQGLFEALHSLATDNAQGEYYLTDLVAMYHKQGRAVASLCLEDPDELRGINSRVELAEMTRIVRDRKNRAVMLSGVTLEDPATTYIDEDVTIGMDSTIGSGVRIGPFAHIRPDSVVGDNAHIGNFVELKKTTLGTGAKANHLSYLGDAVIGDGVNVGAGTITCNYDGEKKHRTTIEAGAFVGSNSALVAPVTIGAGAYVGAGSTITQDVPAGGLGVARGVQHNKPGWAAARKLQREQAATAKKKDT